MLAQAFSNISLWKIRKRNLYGNPQLDTIYDSHPKSTAVRYEIPCDLGAQSSCPDHNLALLCVQGGSAENYQ